MCAKHVTQLRHEKWLATFNLRDENPMHLAERILARPARLELEWTDKDGRETRLYVPDEDGTLMAVDEIIAQREGDLSRRVRFVERLDRRC